MAKIKYFGLNIYHGGQLIVKTFKHQYIGGTFVTKSGLDYDRFGYFDLIDHISDLGFHTWEKLWFRIPSTHAYKEILDDAAVMEMLSYLGKVKTINVYVDGGKTLVEGGEGKLAENDGNDEGNGEGNGEGEIAAIVDENEIEYVDNNIDWGGNWGFDGEFNIEGQFNIDSDSSDEGDYVPSDSDLSDVSLEDLDFIEDEESIELRNRKKLKIVVNIFDVINEHDGFEADLGHDNNSEYENDEVELDDSETDDDECVSRMRKKKIAYDPRCDHKQLEIVLGMHFQDGLQCRDGLTTWAIEHGRFIRFRSVSKTKLLAKCSPPCPWKIYASIVGSNGSFMIKSYAGDHDCVMTMSNKLLSSKWIARRYLNLFRLRYNLSIKELGLDICHRFRTRVPKDRLYKARKIAQEMVRGSVESHYAMVRNYVAQLREVDSEGKYELLLSEGNVFQAFYMGMSALKKGFLKSCRPVIGIDGCFLKTYLGGFLLCATGKDGNNGMFPIAWAVVEGENEVCWSWFLQCLVEHLGISDGTGWTFISDQQKGLEKAVAHLAPQAEHRNCSRHIYMNWKKHHKGETLKTLFFTACYATYEAAFKQAVQDMQSESLSAYEDFMSRNTTKFCKAFISTIPCSDSVDNNISETFNGYILNARGKHVIHMLEEIRSSLMSRQVDKYKEMTRVTGRLTPNIKQLLEKHQRESAFCTAVPAMFDIFQVHCEGEQFVVHVKTSNTGVNSCSCRSWDLTGVPCKQAIAAMRYMELDPSNFVSEYYTVSTYLSAYEFGIPPIVGEKMWPKVEGETVKPPAKRKMPGRPKKKRIRAPDERYGRMTKHGTKMHCGNCQQEGHNSRRCHNPTVVKPPVEKRRRGRPAKAPTAEASSKNHAKKGKQPASSSKKNKSSFFRDRAIAMKGCGVYGNVDSGNAFYHKKCVNLGQFKRPRICGEGSSSSMQQTPQQSEVTNIPSTQESMTTGGAGGQ